MVNLEVINNLWLEIDKLHLSYLQIEESPERIQQKRKLKGYMKEYLCLVTSNQKFYSPTSKAVLYTSILKKGDQFSPSKFSNAWEMLGMYAANLLGQPWRKEFKEIRLYSGGYKYQIENQLLGAEDILMEMGYTLDIEYNRLVVQGILDYDRIVRCHRDCLLAQVESEVLSEIHSAMNSNPMRPCNWGTIFDYRDKYVGSVNHCVRGLMYQLAQKETMYYPYNPQPPPLTPMAGYLGPHELYPTNFSYPMMYHQPYLKPAYSYSSPMSLRETNKNLTSPEEQDYRSHLSHGSITKSKPIDKPKTEPFDTWNSDIKSIPKFEDLLDIERLERMIYDDVDCDRSKKAQEAQPKDKRSHPTEEREMPAKGREDLRLEDAMSLQAENVISKKQARLSPNPSITALQPGNLSVKKQARSSPSHLATEEIPKPEARRKEFKDTKEIPREAFERWECLFCTYNNANDQEICEMCSKSRNRGPEIQPLQRGGRECSNCTLVNPPDERVCAACSRSLSDAPTYI